MKPPDRREQARDPWIVIPAYNEERVLGETLSGLREAGFRHLIVVDDGSSDETSGKAREIEGVIVLRHFINRGKGAAVRTGMEAAKILGADAVITMDGDGQHDPADIPAMLRLLGEGYEVVLGTRMKNPRGMPASRVLANVAGNIFTWLLHGLWVSDSQSGFRAYSRRALEVIETRSDRYEYDSEVIREIRANRLRFTETPIAVRYTEHSSGKLHGQGLVNGVKTLFRMILSS